MIKINVEKVKLPVENHFFVLEIDRSYITST